MTAHKKAALSPEPPYPLLRALLSLALEKAAACGCCYSLIACPDPEARRALARMGRAEARQAAALTALLPFQESPADHLLYETALSLELCAALAQRMGASPVRNRMDEILPEYLDEVYRLVNARALASSSAARPPFSGYIEIMPGRPMAACIGDSFDAAGKAPEALTREEEAALLLLSIVEKEKNALALFAAGSEGNGLLQELFLEFSLLSAHHEQQWIALLPASSPLKRLFRLHQLEAWVCASWGEFQDASGLASIVQSEREQEAVHIQKMAELFRRMGEDVPEDISLPALSALGPNKAYIRDTLQLIGAECPEQIADAASRRIVEQVIKRCGTDIRYEIAPHPIPALRNRTKE